MHRIGIVVVAVMLLSLTAVSSGMAGTRDKCVEKCKEAATFVKTNGIKAAIEEISKRNNRFTWNDGVSYVFLMDMDCKMLAHPVQPELTQSVNLIESKDVNGKPFFHGFHQGGAKRQGMGQIRLGSSRTGCGQTQTHLYLPGPGHAIFCGFRFLCDVTGRVLLILPHRCNAGVCSGYRSKTNQGRFSTLFAKTVANQGKCGLNPRPSGSVSFRCVPGNNHLARQECLP